MRAFGHCNGLCILELVCCLQMLTVRAQILQDPSQADKLSRERFGPMSTFLHPRDLQSSSVAALDRFASFATARTSLQVSRQKRAYSKLEKRVRPSKPLCNARDEWLSRTCASADAAAAASLPTSPLLWLDTCLKAMPDVRGEFHWEPHLGRLKPKGVSWRNETLSHEHRHPLDHELFYHRFAACPEHTLCMQVIDEHRQYHVVCVPDPRPALDTHHPGPADRMIEVDDVEQQIGFRAIDPEAAGAHIDHDDFVLIEINLMSDFDGAAVTAGIIARKGGMTVVSSQELVFKGIDGEHALDWTTPLCDGLPVITDPVDDDEDRTDRGSRQIEACVPTRSQRLRKASQLVFKVAWNLITTGVLVYLIQDAASLSQLSTLSP